MLHYSVKPLRLVLQRSYWLAALFTFASLGACVIVLCMPVHLALRLAVCILIISTALYHIAQHAWLSLPGSWVALDLNEKGGLRLMRHDGASIEAVVLPGSFVSAYLTILNVKIDGTRWHGSLILTPDRIDAEAFRRLRVWLRWGRHDWRSRAAPEEAAF